MAIDGTWHSRLELISFEMKIIKKRLRKVEEPNVVLKERTRKQMEKGTDGINNLKFLSRMWCFLLLPVSFQFHFTKWIFSDPYQTPFQTSPLLLGKEETPHSMETLVFCIPSGLLLQLIFLVSYRMQLKS